MDRSIVVATIWKFSFGVIGALLAMLEPTFDYAVVCTLAVIMDCFTAWRLSVRVKKMMPEKKIDGKFKSIHARRVLSTILKIYSLIVLAFLIDQHILPGAWYLPNIVAGAFCFVQIWSILENESSLNSNRWARLAQKIMVDKAERHFDIDLSDLKSKNDEPEQNTGRE